MPNKLANSILIILIPFSRSQHVLTAGQTAATSRAITDALAYLKAMTLVTLVILGETPVWVLTPEGRKLACQLRDNGQEGLVLKAMQPKLL